MSKLTRKGQYKVAKLAAITVVAEYFNKVAEQAMEPALTEDELAEVIVNTDEKLDDDIIETLDDPTLTQSVKEALEATAKEMKDGNDKLIDPRDESVHPTGSGSIVGIAASNPNANTGGVEENADVKVKETNLLANKETNMNNEVETLKKELNSGTVKTSTLTAAIVKLAEAVEVSSNRLTEIEEKAKKLQDNPDASKQDEPHIETEIDAEDKDRTKDDDKMEDTDKEESMERGGTRELQDNPQHKGASRSLNDVLARHRKR